MKIAILLSTAALSSAFTPSTHLKQSTSLYSSETPETTEVALATEAGEPSDELPPATPVLAINGWVADDTVPCYGLPGSLPPTGFFDPLGFSRKGISLNEVKRNREAEVMHGRVAMVATVGYFAGETVSGPFNIVGPANDQLQQVPAPAFALLTVAIAAAELKRARIGWVEPDLGNWSKTLWTLRENYYPGDLGFDPLGFKPSDPVAFANMQTRELQNGRLAMLGVAGMCAQELVNHRSLLETFEFYQKVYSGENPYALCGFETIC